MSLPVTFPPIFDMGKGFKESEGDLFSVRKFFEQSNTPLIDSTISPKHLHLSGLQIKGYQS
jgi:hypothetical protein